MTAFTDVVAALIVRGDKFLICKRPAHKARGGLWEFAGGKTEPGETKEEALVRECREELGVFLTVGEVFAEVEHVYPDLKVRLTVFRALHHARGDPALRILPRRPSHPRKIAKGAVDPLPFLIRLFAGRPQA